MHDFFNSQLELDPCTNSHSIIDAVHTYSLPETDGLVATWDFASIFCNPPYGRDPLRKTSIRDWLRRCADAHTDHGSEVLALVPVATNTRHWKDHVFAAATAVCFLYDTRLRFLVAGQDAGKGAPMPCAMVYWGTNYPRFEAVFMPYGAVVSLAHLSACPTRPTP